MENDESKMTKVLVRLRDPQTIVDHDVARLASVWPYIPHEIHILAETLEIDRPSLSCPVKGSRSWRGTLESWQAAVAGIPPSILSENPGGCVCEHMIEIRD